MRSFRGVFYPTRQGVLHLFLTFSEKTDLHLETDQNNKQLHLETDQKADSYILKPTKTADSYIFKPTKQQTVTSSNRQKQLQLPKQLIHKGGQRTKLTF